MLVLASQSPRRRQLFSLVIPVFATDEAQLREEEVTAPTPVLLCGRLAHEKAAAVFARRPADVVVGCDTVVELDGRALGKPVGKEDCIQMLSALSGRRHLVHTGVCICTPAGAKESFVATTAVFFSPIPQEEMAAYAATAEPYDKAGGYGIQGWAARFVPRIEGCYYNVMGLPVAALYQKLVEMKLI